MHKGYKLKILMMSVLAFAIAGCASQQGGSPQVRDLSQARQALENSPQYTVKAGDTLYGIAWQHNLDYRQLAAINNIDAPYQIRPGQTIALREDAASMATASNQPAESSSGGGGAVATGLNPQAASVASNDQELDWLLPDESAIQRNQRLTAERDAVDAAEQVAESSSDTPASTPEPEVVAAADPEPAQQSEPQPASEPEPPQESEPETQPEAAPATQSASEDRSSRTYTPAETIDWQWPADGSVVGEFGEGDSITAGIDIAGQKGNLLKRLALVSWYMRAVA